MRPPPSPEGPHRFAFRRSRRWDSSPLSVVRPSFTDWSDSPTSALRVVSFWCRLRGTGRESRTRTCTGSPASEAGGLPIGPSPALPWLLSNPLEYSYTLHVYKVICISTAIHSAYLKRRTLAPSSFTVATAPTNLAGFTTYLSTTPRLPSQSRSKTVGIFSMRHLLAGREGWAVKVLRSVRFRHPRRSKEQLHARLGRRPVVLALITAQAGGHAVLPGRSATATPRHDVVDRHRSHCRAAILAVAV